MWITTFLVISAIETAGLIWFTLMNRSAAQESFLWGYSPEKLVLLFLLFVILLLFIFLVFYSLKPKSRQYQHLRNLAAGEKALWVALWSSILLAITIFFLLIHPQEWYGSYYVLFDHLKAVLFWLLVLCLQTVFFVLVRLSVGFTRKPEGNIRGTTMKELGALCLVFLFALVVKFTFVLPHTYGLYKDVGESKYFNMIFYLFDGRFLHAADDVTTHYPFLYPLLLLFTYAIKNYTFQAILVFNAIFSSSIVFPLYLLARRFLNKHASLILIIIASLIPFQFLTPNRLMSENLYFPLLLWSVYLAFVLPRNPKYRWAWDCLASVFFGLMYLTRFISLAIIPFLFLIWWIKPYAGAKGLLRFSLGKFLRVLIMLLLTALVYSPWVIIGLGNDMTFMQTLGFGITAFTNPQQLTALNLIKWLMLYSMYYVLLAAPVLNLITLAVRDSLSKHQASERRRWLVSWLILLLAFTLAVVRHSWRAYYNLDQPEKIMGRYVIYFVPLFLLTGFIGLKVFHKSAYRSFRNFLTISVLLPALLVGISYVTVIMGKVIPLGENFIQPLISIDGFYIKELGAFFFGILLLLYLGGAYFIWNGREKAVEFVGWALLAFYLFAEPDCRDFLNNENTYQELGYQVSEMMLSAYQGTDCPIPYKIYLSDGFYVDDRKDFAWSLYVRNLSCDWEIIKYDAEQKPELNGDLGFIIYPFDEAKPASYRSYQVWEIDGEKFVIERELGYVPESGEQE